MLDLSLLVKYRREYVSIATHLVIHIIFICQTSYSTWARLKFIKFLFYLHYLQWLTSIGEHLQKEWKLCKHKAGDSSSLWSFKCFLGLIRLVGNVGLTCCFHFAASFLIIYYFCLLEKNPFLLFLCHLEDWEFISRWRIARENSCDYKNEKSDKIFPKWNTVVLVCVEKIAFLFDSWSSSVIWMDCTSVFSRRKLYFIIKWTNRVPLMSLWSVTWIYCHGQCAVL